MQTAAIGLVVSVVIALSSSVINVNAQSVSAPTPASTPAECAQNYRLTDEAAIARDVLSERSNDLVFSEDEWQSTAAQNVVCRSIS